jgi:hypothetical protein
MQVIHETIFDNVQLVLKMKLEEFHQQNYNDFTIEDIWHYCVTKKWKKKNIQEIHIHEIVATIFSVKPSDMLSQVHIHELHQTQLNISLDLEELNMLLKPLKSED